MDASRIHAVDAVHAALKGERVRDARFDLTQTKPMQGGWVSLG